MHEATRVAMLPVKRGLSRVEASCFVGVSADLFDVMVQDGRMPRPARFNARLVWDRVQLDRAMDHLFVAAMEVDDPWVNGRA